MNQSEGYILTVIGARPQFVKAAMVSRALTRRGIPEQIVHTGQHYDREMDSLFFEELEIPEPVVNLGVGSGSHAQQTGEMMMRLEDYILNQEVPPRWVLVYGDTNSTLAGALVAAKLQIPLAHVEAGLRSFNRRMPEEVNRVLTDQISDVLFCPTQTAVAHLAREGITAGVKLVGDVMYDATLFYAERARRLPAPVPLEPGTYYLATVHRAENTDVPGRLEAIVQALSQLDKPVVWPVHPRTRARIDQMHLPEHIHTIAPVGYLHMLRLIQEAAAVLTDSGGVQKEAVWLHTPCITLRDETEWVETLQGGWNQVVGTATEAILQAVRRKPEGKPPVFGRVGEPLASERIAEELMR